jgi:hypothetical protein
MPVKNRNMVTAPKKRLVGKQPHLLAYITPAEAALLKKNGGTGEMVDGIPAFPRGSVDKATVDKAKAKTSTKSTTKTVTNTGSRGSETKTTTTPSYDFGNDDNGNDGPSAAEIAAANAAANAAAECSR